MTPELDKAEPPFGKEILETEHPLAATLAAKEAECEALRVENERLRNGLDAEGKAAWANRDKLKRIRAETFEECARVADEAELRNPDAGHSEVAARLRALASEDSAE